MHNKLAGGTVVDVSTEATESPWVSQIRRGVVELAVLGLLAGERRYGSQLVDDLAAHPGLAISAGTVYPMLARLRKGGLVESHWQESPAGPPRKYYQLTPLGEQALASMTVAWRSLAADLTTILEQR